MNGDNPSPFWTPIVQSQPFNYPHHFEVPPSEWKPNYCLYPNPSSQGLGLGSNNHPVNPYAEPGFATFLNQYHTWASNFTASDFPGNRFTSSTGKLHENNGQFELFILKVHHNSWPPGSPTKPALGKPPSPGIPSSTTCVVPKLRRARTTFTPAQIKFLEAAFEKNQYPDCLDRGNISAIAGLPESRIQIWFKNRRAKYRKFLKNNNVLDHKMTGVTSPPSSTGGNEMDFKSEPGTL